MPSEVYKQSRSCLDVIVLLSFSDSRSRRLTSFDSLESSENGLLNSEKKYMQTLIEVNII